VKDENKSLNWRRPSRPLRIENDSYLWFVTSRTIEERFWLHPLLTSAFKPANRQVRRLCERLEERLDRRLSKTVARANAMRGPLQPTLSLQDAKRIVRGTVGSALARAQQIYHTKIMAVVTVSNHIHLLCQTRGKNLSKFMGYVKARITETINLLTGKQGPLWARRYDAQVVLDDEAASDRLAYCLDNPVDAGLVETFDSWPGTNLAFGMGETDEIEFEYLDRTAWHKRGRPEKLDAFYRTAKLVLSPLPRLKGKSRSLVQQSTKSWLGRRTQTKDRNGPVLGIEKIFETAFESRPKEPKRSRRPYAFGSKDNKSKYFRTVSILYEAYAEASEKYRAGQYDVTFPGGMYRPAIATAC
jgi:REP element-mobilizing transposase RayT